MRTLRVMLSRPFNKSVPCPKGLSNLPISFVSQSSALACGLVACGGQGTRCGKPTKTPFRTTDCTGHSSHMRRDGHLSATVLETSVASLRLEEEQRITLHVRLSERCLPAAWLET